MQNLTHNEPQTPNIVSPASGNGRSFRSTHVGILGLGILIFILCIFYFLRKLEDSKPFISGEKLEQVLAQPIFREALEFRNAGLGEPLDLYLHSAALAIKRKHNKDVIGYHINQPIDPKYINIYFARLEHVDSLSHFRDTCIYTCYKNVIICDLAFIDWMQSDLPWPENPRATDLDRLMERAGRARASNVLLWLLGHELGHLAYGHGSRHFSGESVLGDHNYLEASHAPEELAADRFAIELAEESGWTPDRGEWLADMIFQGLVGYINKLGNEILHGIGRENPLVYDKGPIPINTKSMRDVLFARAINMAITINDRYKLESPDYYESLKSRIIYPK